jgi:eukaryotic-like serine/threonine-protein kinase
MSQRDGNPGANGAGQGMVPTASPDDRTVASIPPRPEAQDGTVRIAPPRQAVPTGTAPSNLALGTPSPATAGPTPSSPFRTEVSGANVLPAPGVRINQYELIRELGQGGMGTVYLARDTKLGRRVAVKFLQTNQPELSQRFLIEARATARCSHENIVIIYEVGEHYTTPFMVLEYLQGQTLQKLIEGGQKMPVGRAIELILPVCRALAMAHEQGIVHRDLKPDNVLVTDQGTVKVLDFGIAKVLQEKGVGESPAELRMPSAAELAAMPRPGRITETGLTRHGAIMGTMAYMSPEQWGIGGIEIDHRTDIWAVGIMLFRMLTGRHPLHPLRGQQLVITAMLDQPMPSVKESISGIPAGLADVIDRCLRKKKDERYGEVKELLRALEPFLPGRFTREMLVDQSPYAGLASFQENDAARFFGRSREIAAMVNRIRTQPMLAVVGGSGVGKSSLVRAGLVPGLKRSGEAWECVVLRPGRNPMAALASVLNPLLATSSTLADEAERTGKLIERLKAEPGYLGSTLRAQAVRENKRLLLFIDQFEELYTNVADLEERQAFTGCLAAAADDPTAPVRVVLSIRSDFLDRVAENPQFLAELNQGLFFLLPPNRDGLRDALVQPAEMAGYHFEDDAIVEDMLDHLAQTPGALPLLQFTAAKMWDARDSTRKLFTRQAYETIGGIGGALASHADSVLAKLTPPAQALVRGIFLRLVTPERTRAVVSQRELEELHQDRSEVHRVIEQLAYARLVVVQTAEAGGTSTVEIVHESLIHAWPTLKRWLDEGHEDSVFMEQLRQAARQWQQKGHDAGLLWRGDIIGEARRFRSRYRGELPWVQESFLRAVFDAHDRGIRRRRVIFAGIVVFLLALVAAAAVALFVINQARNDAQGALDGAKRAEKVAKDAEAQAKVSEKKALDLKAEAEGNLQKFVDAQSAEKLALADKVKAQAQVAMTNEELQRANAELLLALDEAEKEKKKAEREEEKAEKAQRRAEDALVAAQRAEERAVAARKEAEKARAREKERADRLAKQLKGEVIEDLD